MVAALAGVVLCLLGGKKSEAFMSSFVATGQTWSSHVEFALHQRSDDRLLHALRLVPKNTLSSITRFEKKQFLSGLATAVVATTLLLFGPSAGVADDGVAIGKCLFQSCQSELARCVTNPSCLANLACIKTCDGKPDKTACQIKCGDFFENDAIAAFNKCAVTQTHCVPQRQNDNAYPEPLPGSVVKSFDTKLFEGRWYISAGLNKIFDTFPCQVHFFSAPEPGKLYAKLNWRVIEPDGEFLERHAVQRFVAKPGTNGGVLLNHDNDYLHYQDDWYILDFSEKKGEEFILVYYRGRNDAWDGYGGAVLYTRLPNTPDSIKPRVAAACSRAGLDFSKFSDNDNTCKAAGDFAEKLRLREAFAKKELLLGEQALQERLTAERNLITPAVLNEEQVISKEASKALSRIEAKLAEYETEIAKEVIQVTKDISAVVENAIKGSLDPSRGSGAAK